MTARLGLLVLLVGGALTHAQDDGGVPSPRSGMPEAGVSHLSVSGSAPHHGFPETRPHRFGTGDAKGVSAQVPPGTYQATIRRTPWGVAHIEAADLGSLGFGEGYAQAEDHLCTMAEHVLRVRGELAKHLGRGEDERHLRSDLALRALGVVEAGSDRVSAQPPEVRRWLEGFAAGYNLYLAETGVDGVPGSCRGQSWVQPLTAEDLLAAQRYFALTSTALAPAIAEARPPDTASAGSGAGSPPDEGEAKPEFELPRVAPSASNAWALGRDWTENGRGILVANPHFAWLGVNRFWEKHLTIPGALDVYGVNVLGMPGVLFGFTEGVAWTHTVARGTALALNAVELLPGDPTRYRFGEEERSMIPLELEVAVLGEPEPVRRTLWSTHHGPVLSSAATPWTEDRAFALRDANFGNENRFLHLLDVARARSLEDLRQAFETHQALGWVNVVAVDAEGSAWYADVSSRPNLDEAVQAEWILRQASDPLAASLARSGILLLDGSDPASAWLDDPRARLPGIVPLQEAPQVERSDYVFNANESYWLVNARARPLADHAPVFGPAPSPQSPRARRNARILENAPPDRPAGADGRFTLAEVQEAILSNRSLSADLLLPELVSRCREAGSVVLDGVRVELDEACDVLALWDRHFDLDSRGAVLFREWLGHYERDDFLEAGPLFAVGFDPTDPVGTPHTLAEGGLALENLARAVRLLGREGIPLDVPLGQIQYAAAKPGHRIPIHGAHGRWEGTVNRVSDELHRALTLDPVERPLPVEGSRFLTEAGYPVFHGASFLMALEFTDDGPRAEAILTYGQSGDPDSEHFTDQTEMFSRKEWRPVLFRPEEVAAGARRTYTVGVPNRPLDRTPLEGTPAGRTSPLPEGHPPLSQGLAQDAHGLGSHAVNRQEFAPGVGGHRLQAPDAVQGKLPGRGLSDGMGEVAHGAKVRGRHGFSPSA